MRSASDVERGPTACLDTWGISYLGHREWKKTLRIALYDRLEDTRKLSEANAATVAALPEKKRLNATRRYVAQQKQEKMAELRAALKASGVKCVLVLQTLSRQQEAHSITGTICWDALGWHGPLYDSQGTINRHEDGYDIIPVLNPDGHDWATGHFIRKWMRWGHAVAAGKLAAIRWPESHILPTEEAVRLLERIATSREVAVDIEAYTPGRLITAIGVASEHGAVSVPWDSYNVPAGHTEPGYDRYPLGERCAEIIAAILRNPGTSKVFHHGGFDIPELEARGLPVRGPCEDTLLAHRVAYPQHRHGLQIACATEFLVEPWKELFHIDGQNKDDPAFWISRPDETRSYNCKDSYATWLLWQSLKPRIGLLEAA